MNSLSDSNTTSDGYFLGLDISTSCTGVCVLDKNYNVIYLDVIRLSKFDTFFDKCEEFKRFLTDIKQKYAIKKIVIEKNAQSFRKGLSSANVINVLARFNGAASYITFETLGVVPCFIDATSSRAVNGIKVNFKDKSSTTKEKVFCWVQNTIKHTWPQKKTGKFKTECYDMADAYVLARVGVISENRKVDTLQC